jgi:urease accessory protein
MKKYLDSSVVKFAYWLAPLLMLPSLAFAHPGHAEHGGLYAGFAHPVSGVDHLLAMVAVGIWAVHRGGLLRRLAPTTFVFFMTVGALLGANSASLPYGDPLIALSVVVFGMGIVVAARVPPAVGILCIGVFAVLHGFAHGVEATNGMSGEYLLGMLLATALLHLVGIALALAAKHLFGGRTVRWSGIPIAAAGVTLLFSAT